MAANKIEAVKSCESHCCAVREHTADGVNVGRCWFALKDGICPRHGDVREVQRRYADDGGLTNDYELEPRSPRGQE